MRVSKEAIQMIKNGISLNKINKKTGIGKSSLYYHYQKINGKKYKNVIIGDFNNEDLGEFIGIFAGDGNFYFDKIRYQYKIRISTGLYELGYRKYIKFFLNKLFKKKPRTYIYNKSNVEINEYYSKDIYKLIIKYLNWDKNKTKTVRIRNFKNMDDKFLSGFIRGIFDTDGGIYKPKKKVAFGTSSRLLAIQIKNILQKFDMKPGFYKYKNKDFWYIDLYGKRSERFMGIIKPNNPNKVMCGFS